MMNRHLLLLLSLLFCIVPAQATAILYCSTNGGVTFGSTCAQSSIFSNLAASLDWGAPTGGGWAAHPGELGLGQAINNTHDATGNNLWTAVGSDATNIGL